MEKLRLLLTEDCNKGCEGCCNKDWDLSLLPVVKSFKGYSEILITGGEPMLYPNKIIECVNKIRQVSDANIYLYTAYIYQIATVLNILDEIDGITLTLHDKCDIEDLKRLNRCLLPSIFLYKSMRLNIFDNIDVSDIDLKLWKIKDNMVWIENCPLPKDEILMKY